MKKTITMAVAALILAAFLCPSMAQVTETAKKKNEKQTALFNVSMTCENCKKRIEREIGFTKGVTDMLVNLDNKTVWVEYKSKDVDNDKLIAIFEDLGYEASLVEPVKQQQPTNQADKPYCIMPVPKNVKTNDAGSHDETK